MKRSAIYLSFISAATVAVLPIVMSCNSGNNLNPVYIDSQSHTGFDMNYHFHHDSTAMATDTMYSGDMANTELIRIDAGSIGSSQMNFWGDSTLTIICKNKPVGYNVRFFKTQDGKHFINLKRGKIDRTIAIDKFPSENGLELYEDSVGTYYGYVGFYVENDERDYPLGLGFIDINFDDEYELVIDGPGYNRRYAYFFDLVNGDAIRCPGLLTCMEDDGVANFVCDGEGYSIIDRERKQIVTREAIGVAGGVTTVAGLVYGRMRELVSVFEASQRDSTGEHVVRHIVVDRLQPLKIGILPERVTVLDTIVDYEYDLNIPELAPYEK